MRRPLPNPLSKPGPIIEYLSKLRDVAQRFGGARGKDMLVQVDETEEAVRRVLLSEDGRVLMDLLEKSIDCRLHDVSENSGALGATMAQRFIASDLNRIASNERADLQKYAEAAAAARPRRTGRRS